MNLVALISNWHFNKCPVFVLTQTGEQELCEGIALQQKGKHIVEVFQECN